MTSLAMPSAPGVWVRFASGLAGIGSWIVRITRSWKNRRQVATLTGFDDRMLADIGLRRADLNDALSEPVWRDPTTILATRVHERRAHRRRVVGFDGNLMTAPPLVPEGRERSEAARSLARPYY